MYSYLFLYNRIIAARKLDLKTRRTSTHTQSHSRVCVCVCHVSTQLNEVCVCNISECTVHAIIPYQIPDQFTSTSIKIYFICLWLALCINTIERLSACVMCTSALCTLSKWYLSLLNAYIFWPSFPSAALIYLFSIIPCVLCAVPAANIIYWKSSIFAKKYAIFGCNQYRNVFHLWFIFICLSHFASR